MATLTKLYTMQEAAKHNSPGDCWVVINSKVYDVSSYLEKHPGGDDVLLQVTGKDATDEFEDAGHSRTARKFMKSLCVGELDTSVVPQLEVVSEKQKYYVPEMLVDLSKQYWVVPVAALGISVVVTLLYLRKK